MNTQISAFQSSILCLGHPCCGVAEDSFLVGLAWE